MLINFRITGSTTTAVQYAFDGDDIIVNMIQDGEQYSDTFPLSQFGNGELQLEDKETGETLIKTSLPINPIVSAKREDGELKVELRHFVSPDEQREHILFPETIDSKDYDKWLLKGIEANIETEIAQQSEQETEPITELAEVDNNGRVVMEDDKRNERRRNKAT